MNRLSLILMVIFVKRVDGSDIFQLNIDNQTGAYNLRINGQLWLRSGPTFFNAHGQTWSTDNKDRPLVLTNVKTISGHDVSETWEETQFTYTFGNTTMSVMTAIRLYNGSTYSKRVLFTQTYLSGLSSTSKGTGFVNETVAGFPCFQVEDPGEKLGFLSFGGYMLGDTNKEISKFDSSTDNINDGIAGGPLALLNNAGNAVVISPYNHFMASSLWHTGKPGGSVCWGIMGGVNKIPVNFTYSTLMVFDGGINKAFDSWGFELQKQFGLNNSIEREKNIKSDISLNYLGYWTDNGAYYYYHTEDNKTYEDTLLDVSSYARTDNRIPYRYLQLDSWWYPKDKDYRAVLTWTPMKNIFPHGIKYLCEKTYMPIVAHNRYWSKSTPYAKANGGNFSFIIGQQGSLPDDQSFWSYLLAEAKSWGLITYEQDWLNVQTQEMEELLTNLTLGRDWLLQMATAARENSQTIQYCMANPRHALQSMEFPVVTQARVSDDYLYEEHNHREPQWKVGVTSLFARAVGLLPYKDTFWTTSFQPGNPYNRTEPYPALESAVSSLTAGPVGPSDMINITDTRLLMKCCNTDGLLLKPDRPATSIDKQIIVDAFRKNNAPKIGEIWTTHSYIDTNGEQKEYGVLFAADVTDTFIIGIEELGFDSLSEGIFYPYNNVSQWNYFNASTRIDLSACTKHDFCMYYFSPYLTSTIKAVLGEHKWIPMSSKRFRSINVIEGGKQVDIHFEVSPVYDMVTIAYILNDKLYGYDCYLFAGEHQYCTIYEDYSVDIIG